MSSPIEKNHAWNNTSSLNEDGWPVLRIVGHMQGVSRKDVRAYAKGMVDRHFPEHRAENPFISEIKWNGGWLFELCLGGDGKSRLPAIQEFLQKADPHEKMILPAGHRYGELHRNDNGDVVFRLLPEGEGAKKHTPELPASKRAGTLYQRFESVLVFGAVMFVLGATTLVGGTFASMVGKTEKALADIAEEKRTQVMLREQLFYDLPLNNVPDVELRNVPGAMEYIEAIVYEGGWQPVIGCVGQRCDEWTEETASEHQAELVQFEEASPLRSMDLWRVGRIRPDR